jgi:hypothetical protein
MKWTKAPSIWFQILLIEGLCSADFSLRGLVLASTKTRRLKPAPLEDVNFYLVPYVFARLALLDFVTEDGESPVNGVHKFSVGCR